SFAGAYAAIRLSVLAVFAAVYGVIHLSLRGHAVQVESVVPSVVGSLFVVLGGVLGKIRPNWFVGIRTPWTLSGKPTWTRPPRRGRFLSVAAGVLTWVAAAVSPRLAVGVLVVTSIAASLVLMVYSYRVWRDDPDKIPPAGTLPADEA